MPRKVISSYKKNEKAFLKKLIFIFLIIFLRILPIITEKRCHFEIIFRAFSEHFSIIKV